MNLSNVRRVVWTNHALSKLLSVPIGRDEIERRIRSRHGEWYVEKETVEKDRPTKYEVFWEHERVTAHVEVERVEGIRLFRVVTVFVVGNPYGRYEQKDRFEKINVD